MESINNDSGEATSQDSSESEYGTLRYDTAPKRRSIIRGLVAENGFCSAAELSEQLGVSEMTIRRDIIRLASTGLIRSVHGGAAVMLKEPVSAISERAFLELAAKRAIGRKAAEEVDPNFVVAFDSGTTTVEVAKQIPLDTPMSVVTNSIPIIEELGHRDWVHLIGIGGVYDSGLEAFSVTSNDPVPRDLRVDVLFLAARHITADGTYTDTHGPADTKRAMISIADHVVLVADTSKFAPSPKAMVRVCGLDVCEKIITDDKGGPEVERALANYRGEVNRMSVPVEERVAAE